MSRADDALQRLYESADLRDELTDEEADQLLKWAESQIAGLDQSAGDDETFAAQVAALLKLIKNVNRFAGRQGQLTAQVDDPLPGAIAASAGALGYAASPEQIAAAATGDPAGTVAALTGLLGGAAAPPAPAPPAPDEPSASPEPLAPPDEPSASMLLAPPELSASSAPPASPASPEPPVSPLSSPPPTVDSLLGEID